MRVATAVCMGLLLFSGVAQGKRAPARSSKSQSPTALIKSAERLYARGKYREAAELLKQAHARRPHPRLIYNIARAYDQAGDLQAALDHYQQYVSSSEGTDPKLLKRSALAIDRLRGLTQKAEEERRAQEAERLRLEEERRQAEARAKQETEEKERAMAEATARREAELKRQLDSRKNATVGAYVAGGIGVAALATGGTFGVLALLSKGEFDAATDVGRKIELEDATRTQAIVADVGIALGIAGIATAVLLYPKGPPPQGVSFAVGPTGAWVSGSF